VQERPSDPALLLARIPSYLYLLQAKNVMDRDYAEPLDVAVLARAAFASPSHFSRSFRQAFGETPHQYLLRRRIERAKELLRGTEHSVTEICLSVGFQSLGSFSTAFRSLVGEPPTAYRRRWRLAERQAASMVPACYTLMWTRPVSTAAAADE
jgi:AraC-like DNA-binding protein